jgi:hypothetical protein
MRLRSALARWLAPLLTILPAVGLLAGCGGGGGSSGNAQVRLINMTQATALDVYANTSATVSNVAARSVSSYASVGAGTYTASFNAAGTTTTLLAQTRTWSNGVQYSLLAYERYGAVQAVQISENQAAPPSGSASINFYNLATDAGPVDIYVTAATATSLAGLGATFGNIASPAASGYIQFSAGTYSIWITAAGNKSDLRLKLDSVTLANQQVATLALTPTTGGVLVDGVLSTQNGNVSFYPNTQARVRVVAALANGALVDATADAVALATGQQSTTVGDYAEVAAGTPLITVSSGGTTISSATQTLTAGGDYTLLVYGDLSSGAQSTLLADDNRISDTGSTYAKIRLVHALTGLTSSLDLYVNSAAKAANVALGTASGYAAQNNTTGATVQVLSPAAVVYTATDVSFTGGATYTLFMLGDVTAVRGLLVQDH